ncbi:MAG: MerR family transcriptional regulator [Bifidobacterium sp.]|nr:MerR family transcriptional regulator [Bifidobacterium sp.]
MCQYTTGQIADRCGVSVRTVQYYDSRGILSPSQLSGGGRRLYDDADVKRLGVITFLRGLGFSIDDIKDLLADEQSGNVIDALIGEQETRTMQQLHDAQSRMDTLVALRKALREVKDVDDHDLHALFDARFIVSGRMELRHARRVMAGLAVVMGCVEAGTLVYSIMARHWWVFGIGMAAVMAMGAWLAVYYWRRVAYLCPKCHTVFRPGFWRWSVAGHTPTARRLTCPHCGHRGWCAEVNDDRTGIPAAS